MPRPIDLPALINSTTYPPVPSLEDLEDLRASLVQRSGATKDRLLSLDRATADKLREARKDKKRKEREQTNAWNAHLEQEAAAQAKAKAAGVREKERDKEREREREGEDGLKVKRERTASPVHSNISATSGKPHGGLPTTYTAQHKKKKQKRIQDSDDEQARATPTSPTHATQSGLKVRLAGQPSANAKSRPSSSLQFSGADEQPIPLPSPSTAAVNIDWSVPTSSSRPLVPPRPGITKPPKPGPKKQSEVEEDYSNVKAPSQIGLPTFWNSVEPYLREIREDDLAMLGFKATALDSMDIPPRGRHYSDVWDEEDGNPPGTTHRISVPNLRQITGDVPPPSANSGSASSRSAANSLPPAWLTGDMGDDAVTDERRGLGNIAERLIAAVIPDSASDVAARKKEVEGTYGWDWVPRPEEGLAAKINARELEERVKKELRGVMLLGERDEFDPSKRDDDEITSSLRQCQRLLEAQISMNEARKARLVTQSKNRLAYAEYQTRLDTVEKAIEAGWAKRVKKHGFKNKSTTDKHGNVTPRPPVPEAVRTQVRIREKWLYGTPSQGEPGQEGYKPAQPGIGQLFKQLPLGQVRGLPTTSIYEGLEDEREEEEVQAALGLDGE